MKPVWHEMVTNYEIGLEKARGNMSSGYVDRQWQGHYFDLLIVLLTIVVVACDDRSDIPEPPAAPTNLVATAIFENGFSLAWQDNSENELTFYIDYDLGHGFESVPRGTIANDTDIFFGLIIPDREYKFRVYAISGKPWYLSSEYSNIITVAPLPFTDQPPSIPYNLVINPTNMNEAVYEAELSWFLSASDTVTDKVQIESKSILDKSWSNSPSNGTDGTITFVGLTYNIRHSFRVYSVDTARDVRSDYSQVVNINVGY